MNRELLFSEEDLIDPIFVDPPDDLGRENAWGGPYGFLLGGLGDPSYREIAQQYFDAANQLVDDILNQSVEDFTIAMPILYLYRHAIELILKAAMGGAHGHQLDELASEFSAYVETIHGEEVPSWLLARLREVAEIDPRSTSFRYAEKTRSKKKGVVPLGGEYFIDLHHLRLSMAALYKVLERVARVGEQSAS